MANPKLKKKHKSRWCSSRTCWSYPPKSRKSLSPAKVQQLEVRNMCLPIFYPDLWMPWRFWLWTSGYLSSVVSLTSKLVWSLSSFLWGGVSGHSSPVKALTETAPARFLSVSCSWNSWRLPRKDKCSHAKPQCWPTTHKDCATCHICIHLSSITIWTCGSPHAMFVYHTIDSFATLWAQHSNPCPVCGSLQILRDLHNCDIISSVPQEMEFVTLPSPNLALAEQNQYLRLQKLYSTKWFDQKRKILGGLRGVLNWQNRGLQFNLLIWSVRLYMAVDLNSSIYSTNGHSSRIRKIYSRILGEPHVYLPRGSHVKIAR